MEKHLDQRRLTITNLTKTWVNLTIRNDHRDSVFSCVHAVKESIYKLKRKWLDLLIAYILLI